MEMLFSMLNQSCCHTRMKILTIYQKQGRRSDDVTSIHRGPVGDTACGLTNQRPRYMPLVSTVAYACIVAHGAHTFGRIVWG